MQQLKFNQDGTLAQIIVSPIEIPLFYAAPEGFDPSKGAYLLNGEVYLIDDALAQVLANPLPDSAWDFSTMSWVSTVTIEERRYSAWQSMKANRDEQNLKPIVVNGNLFDANQLSQQRINGAVTLAMLAPDSWTIEWTLADNTTVTLTKQDILDLGIAIGTRTSQVFEYARQLRAQIEQTNTLEELSSITWEFGTS